MAIRSEVTALRMLIYPGEIQKEELKEHKISQNDFARQMGMQPSHISELLHGKRNMTHDIAFRLKETLNIPAEHWMGYMFSYERDMKAKQEREVQYSSNSELSHLARVVDIQTFFQSSRHSSRFACRSFQNVQGYVSTSKQCKIK